MAAAVTSSTKPRRWPLDALPVAPGRAGRPRSSDATASDPSAAMGRRAPFIRGSEGGGSGAGGRGGGGGRGRLMGIHIERARHGRDDGAHEDVAQDGEAARLRLRAHHREGFRRSRGGRGERGRRLDGRGERGRRLDGGTILGHDPGRVGRGLGEELHVRHLCDGAARLGGVAALPGRRRAALLALLLGRDPHLGEARGLLVFPCALLHHALLLGAGLLGRHEALLARLALDGGRLGAHRALLLDGLLALGARLTGCEPCRIPFTSTLHAHGLGGDVRGLGRLARLDELLVVHERLRHAVEQAPIGRVVYDVIEAELGLQRVEVEGVVVHRAPGVDRISAATADAATPSYQRSWRGKWGRARERAAPLR